MHRKKFNHACEPCVKTEIMFLLAHKLNFHDMATSEGSDDKKNNVIITVEYLKAAPRFRGQYIGPEIGSPAYHTQRP